MTNDPNEHAKANARAGMETIRALMADKSNGADNEQEIHEGPLCVRVRGEWHEPGTTPALEEYEILLSTGGPALRVVGTLGRYAEPDSALLEWQDWGTEWTLYDLEDADANALLEYAQFFYYGEG